MGTKISPATMEIKIADVAKLPSVRPIRTLFWLRVVKGAKSAKGNPPGLAMLNGEGQKVN